jgi:2'-5' RNA ligase
MAENNTGQVRSFIAIELPQGTKRELAYLQEGLKRACGYCPAKWVTIESIHLTLNFLGDVPLSRLDDIKSAVAQAAAASDTFGLALEGLGAFPNLERPHIVWVGLSGNVEKLSNIQKRLEQLLVMLGFNSENRPFSPHLTLARVRDEASAADKKRLGQAISSTTCKTDCPIPVRQVSLIKSQLTPAGSIYTVLSSATLGRQTRAS